MNPVHDDVLQQVIHAVSGMCAEWGIPAGAVRGDTRLAADLGFSSIETLHLLAVLNLRFGRQLPFNALARHGGGYAGDLTVAELADLVRADLAGAEAPAHG